MSSPSSRVITHEPFCARFAALVLDQRVLPKKRDAIRILLVSAVIGFETGTPHSEAQVNATLKQWVDDFGAACGLDHVTVRRLLVDEGYLTRDAFGRGYVANARGYYFRYEPMIRTVDLHALIASAREERATRKSAHGRRGRE
jgi:hypothetical protein